MKKDISSTTAAAATNGRPFGIYLHWPFCRSKCPYCDFFSKISPNVDQENIIAGYQDDLNYYHELTADRTVGSIFFGGGTPSLIKPQLIEKIINHITTLWPTAPDIETTLEANPNTDNTPTFFADFRTAGINRLSLGVQALNETDLKFLGRTHNLTQALSSIDNVLKNFDNHSMDLIYARPAQKLSAWKEELRQAASFGFRHLSLYQLTIEDGTAFARKDIRPLEDEAAAEMYEFTGQYLKEHGFPRYEVSNFAPPEFQSRHNLLYWHGDDYLGIGPSAHGRLLLKDKILALTHPRQSERLTPFERAEELLIMGLRLTEGINKARFTQNCGLNFDNLCNQQKLKDFSNLGLLINTPETIRLTDSGFLLMNKIIEDLFI